MKKICFVTTVSITIKSFLLQFKDYLVNNDYDVTFICNTDEGMYELCNNQVHYIPVPMKRGVGLEGLSVINKLTRIFRDNKFDIIQYSTPNAALYASIAAKRAKCSNRLYCQWGIRYMGFDGGIKRMILKKIEKIVCKKSSVIECESYSIYRFSISEKLYPSSKASVIWNGSACGVDLNKYCIEKKEKWREEIRSELKITERAPVFGYVGRITRDKGANELLSAFREVVKKKDAYLLMIGMFDDANTIEAELRKWAEGSKHVIFVDWTDKVEKYYSAMDVFCSYFSSTCCLALQPYFLTSSGLSIQCSIVLITLSIFFAGTDHPSTFGSIVSTCPGTSVTIPGSPIAAASITTKPNPSL